MARFLDDLTPDDLRQTTAQAIDHAYKSAAEVAEMHAQFLGALGTIAELTDENRRLRERIDALGQEQSVRHRSRRAVGRLRARIRHLVRR